MFIDDYKFTCQGSPQIDISSIWFKALIVTQNLTGAGSGHGGHQKTVAQPVFLDLLFEIVPIVQPGELGVFPHIKLENTL